MERLCTKEGNYLQNGEFGITAVLQFPWGLWIGQCGVYVHLSKQQSLAGDRLKRRPLLRCRRSRSNQRTPQSVHRPMRWSGTLQSMEPHRQCSAPFHPRRLRLRGKVTPPTSRTGGAKHPTQSANPADPLTCSSRPRRIRPSTISPGKLYQPWRLPEGKSGGSLCRVLLKSQLHL